MGSFDRDTAVRRTDSGFLATLSPDWEIWGPNGGYLCAIALRAAGAAAPSGHRPSTYSCQYLNTGRSGEAQIDCEQVRESRAAGCFNVRLRQGDKVLVQAQVWTNARDEGPACRRLERPEVPLPEALDLLEDRDANAVGGRFRNNFDRKATSGAPPGVMRHWFRYRDYAPANDPFLDAARALLLIDTMVLPAHARGLGRPIDYQATTISLSASFHDSAFESDWLLADARSDLAARGAIHGEVAVWGVDGALLATGANTLLQVPPRPTAS